MQLSKRFQLLLVSIFLYLILAPFLSQYTFAYLVVNALLTLVLLVAVFTIHQNKILLILSLALLVSALAPLWLNLMSEVSISPVLEYVCIAIYLSIVICSMLVRFFSATQVSASMIYAALCFYLLTGILWGALYSMLDILIPGAFHGWITDLPSNSELHFHGFIYFSFTTLTTLGYGDIAPNSLQVAPFCIVEAIIGQFILSVFIARLIGIYIAQKKPKNS